MDYLIRFTCLVALIPPIAAASSLPVRPTPAHPDNATFVGLITSPGASFDGPVSTRVDDAVIWVTGDTGTKHSFSTNAIFWSNLTACGEPDIERDGSGQDEFPMYRNNNSNYYNPSQRLCSSSSDYCSGGSRYLMWPSSRLLPVDNGTVTKLYLWMNNVHYTEKIGIDSPQWPSVSLYRSDHIKGSGTANLPPVHLVKDDFWPVDAAPIGHDGWVYGEDDGLLYLYGRKEAKKMFLARVAPEDIEDVSKYEYWHDGTVAAAAEAKVSVDQFVASGAKAPGTWTKTRPALTDVAATVPNAGPVTGTFWYSKRFASYLWIGGSLSGAPEFWMSSTPRPEGPWAEPWLLAKVKPGSKLTYSYHAHPDISEYGGNGGDIYISYSVQDGDTTSNRMYYVQWK